jgi:hypothetical protein
MRSVFLASIPILCLAVQACSSDAEPAPSTSTGSRTPDGAGSVDDAIDDAFRGGGGDGLRCSDARPEQVGVYDAWYAEYAELMCRRQYECCTEDERSPIAPSTLEGCLEDPSLDIDGRTAENLNSMDCGRILFRADAAADCLEQLRSLSCDELDDFPDCIGDRGTRIWEPTSSLGERCDGYSVDCVGGYCESGAQLQGDGVCSAPKAEGTACLWDKECASNNCPLSEDSCQPPEEDEPFCSRY